MLVLIILAVLCGLLMSSMEVLVIAALWTIAYLIFLFLQMLWRLAHRMAQHSHGPVYVPQEPPSLTPAQREAAAKKEHDERLARLEANTDLDPRMLNRLKLQIEQKYSRTLQDIYSDNG